jgi:DNA-directed RNA polymerase specialized sigma24 family protein
MDMNSAFGIAECRPVIRWCSTPSGVLQAVVMHALQLRRECREVYVLCDIQGCSITETAASLGVSVDVVIRRLKRARGQMEGVINRLCESRAVSED